MKFNKMIYNFQRTIAGTLVMSLMLTAILGATIPASAEEITIMAGNWYNSENFGGTTSKRSDAVTKVSTELTNALSALSVTNTNTVTNKQDLIKFYCVALIYADWFTVNRNALKGESTEPTSDEIVYLFSDFSRGDISIPAIDSDGIETTFQSFESLSGLTGEDGLSPELVPFNAGNAVLGNGDPETTTIYYDTLCSILREYVKPGIVKGYNTANNRGSTETLSDTELSGVDSAWVDGIVNSSGEAQTEQKSYNESFMSAISVARQGISKYVDIANTVITTYGAVQGIILGDEVIGATTGDESSGIELCGQHYVRRTDTIGMELGVDVLAICMAFADASSPISTGTSNKDGGSSNTFELGGDLSNVIKVLSNASLSGGDVVFNDANTAPNLTDVGYFTVAAGVVYDPFVSYAGNDRYLSTLCRFMKDTSRKDDLIQTLQAAINRKKPLYVTDGMKNQWATVDSLETLPVANYRTAFLKDILEPMDGSVSVFCVAKGQMVPSQVDSSTFDYVQHGGGSSSGNNSQTASIDSEVAGATGTFEGGTTGSSGYTGSDGTYTTPGTDELVASGAEMSRPVLISSGMTQMFQNGSDKLVSKIGALTAMVIRNAASDCKGNAKIKAASTEMVFVNGLGDIVLSDGTVVLPAIANPVLYDYSDVATAVGTEQTQVYIEELDTYAPGSGVAQDEAETTTGYYPYTASLLNHYPLARFMSNGTVEISDTKSEGKYVMTSQNSRYEISQIKTAGSKKAVDVKDLSTSTTVWIANKSLALEADKDKIVSAMPWLKQPNVGVRSLFGFAGDVAGERYIQTYTGGNNRGVVYFPLTGIDADIENSFFSVALPLVTSAVRYISSRDASDVMTASGRFRVESYICDLVGQGMLGTQYAETLVRNNQLSYDELVADQYNRLTILFKDVVSGVLDTVGHIDGVLAIKDGYSNSFFNTIMNFLQEFYLLIAVVLMIIVAVKFLKGNYSIFYVAFIALMVFMAFEVYVVWMPTAVPSLYNMAVNDIVEETVWNTVAVSAEKYDETYRNTNRRDAVSGKERAYTATITLYKLTYAEMQTVADHVGLDYEEVKRGEIIWLDRKGGIFIQGDQIKMSLDSLMANNTMRGLYETQWADVSAGAEPMEVIPSTDGTNPYIIKLTNPYVSLESYYTPFCQIERAFMVNLNKFSNIFTAERKVNSYGQDMYKDSFLYQCYTTSGIVLAPGDDDILRQNIRTDMIAGDSLVTPELIIGNVHYYFDPQEDWLNLRSVFGAPSDAMQNSLWGKMLVRQGYYRPNWEIDETGSEKLSELIRYINDQTRQFIINNMEQLNYLSDENAIKLVSLYATTCFTHRVSEFGYWLYPNYINASDIELVDVLYGAMTTMKDRAVALDGDIVNTVVYNLGFIGAVLILVITIVAVIFVFIMTYLVPVLYGLLGVILVYKLMNSEQSIGLVKGYIKVTLTTTILYAIFSFGLRIVKFGGYNWYGYVACLVVILLCLYFLFFVVMSVITNPMELGNETLMRNLFNAADRLTGNRLSRIVSNRLSVNTRNSYNPYNPGVRGFFRHSPIDNRFNGNNPRRRGEHYGRWEDFDDASLSRRAQIIGRFGQLAEHSHEVGRTRTGFRTTAPMRGVRAAARGVRAARDNVSNAVDSVRGTGGNVPGGRSRGSMQNKSNMWARRQIFKFNRRH